ncbi:MAG TPA: DUF4838 domain-containing protein [Opitutales bacterium]|nr:DUF4838 domain-containing protein [Opitutales bacterium]
MKTVAFASAVLACVGAAGGAELVENGKTDFKIVGTVDAAKPDVLAAEELALHLKLATGAEFPIVRGEASGKSFELGTATARKLIGEARCAALAEEESLYVVKGDTVAIVGGGAAGLCYGVYSFLERELGCRWFNQEDGPFVPKRTRLEVNDGEHREKPRLAYRMIIASGYARHADSRDRLFYFRNRSNQIDGSYENVRDDLKGCLPVRIREVSPGCHSLFMYLPPDSKGQRSGDYYTELTNGYFKAHPEWYTLNRAGKRVKDKQLCLANREMRAELTKNLLARIRAKGGKGFFDLSAQDTPDELCCCPDCQALVNKCHSQGAPLFDYLHEVAPKVKAEFPEAILHFLVYRKEQTQRPPVGLPPWPDNLAAVFAPIDNDFSKPYDAPTSLDCYEDLKGWCKLVKTWTWYYPFAYGADYAPTPGLERTAVDTRLAVEAGLTGGYYEHDVGTYQGVNFADAETWMILQHYRDPNRDWKELRQEFFDYAYGAAAPDLIRYSDELEKRLAEWPTRLTWDGGFPGRFSKDGLRKLQALFDRAEAKVAVDPLVLQRVREARFGLDVLTLGAKAGDPDTVYQRATNTLETATKRRYTREPAIAKTFRDKVLGILKTKHFLSKVVVKPLPEEFAGISEDRIVQIFPQQAWKGYTERVPCVEAATGYELREPLRPGKKFPIPFPCGFYDKANEKFLMDTTIPEAEFGNGEFRFHKLGTVKIPTVNCIVWFGRSWMLSASAEDCYKPGVDDTWVIWASLRFLPDRTVAYDRVVMVRTK